MLPLYLSIEGLYSYQDKQEIDFTTLTEAGLFGIFGTVGSGKSSILEAIGYALYGETERLNSKEKRTYNMLNLKSNHVVIDFQFLNFEGRKFRFVAQWRRRKKFHEITDHERVAYEWINENWIPLESNDGMAITNLSYANFRRTIIIPQGQFKEFLELKGKDRSEMMKEIFFLNKYDLGPKVSILLSDTNKNIENLKGALSSFEEVSTEIIDDKKVQLENSEKELFTTKKEFEALQQTFQVLEAARKIREELHLKSEELAKLDLKTNHIHTLEKSIVEYETASNNFREHINNLSTTTLSRNTLLLKIESIKENKDNTKNALLEIENEIEVIKPQFDNLQSLKDENQDFIKILQNIDFQANISEKESRIKNGNLYLQNQIKLESELKSNIIALEEQLDLLKNTKIKTEDLMVIESWYQQYDYLKQTYNETQNRLTHTQTQIANAREFFSKNNLQQENWQSDIESSISDIYEKESALIQKESELRVKQELSQFISNLHDGEPCPLCGAEHHPSPMEIQQVDETLNILLNEKESLKSDKISLDKLSNEAKLITRSIDEKKIDTLKLEQEIATIQKSIQAHEMSFIWSEFDRNNRTAFETLKSEYFNNQKIIKTEELNLKQKREDLQKNLEVIAKSEKVINELQNEINILKSNIQQNSNQLLIVKIEDYAQTQKEDLENKIADNNHKIQTIDNTYQELTKKFVELKTNYAQIKGSYTEAQEQFSRYTITLQELQNTVNKLLLQYNFADVATVKNILDKNIDIIQSRKNIQDFYVHYNTLNNRINELKTQISADNYSDEIYADTSMQLNTKKDHLEALMRMYGALKEDLERLSLELAKKEEILIKYNQLELRKENLKVLDNMFRGNGFVNYVSSIHLHQLCEIANQRFHRLTKNQLSLVINENNEFEVIDYLNNGYRRSAKTLSGGQSFQASLCLALALAENIQSLNKADKNFFFIDEGFGTQDSESINTVFDTLQYLHHENRVVGIISHVEELKERMPRSISVVKDLEKGSQIVVN